MLSLILLSITSSLVAGLLYQNRALKKEHEKLLNESQEEAKLLFLKSRYASMGETVGNIAHQWKQPLNAIGAIQNSIKASLVFQGEISKDKLLNSVETSFKLLQHLAETIDTFYSFLSQRNNATIYFNIADELDKVRKITEYSFENSHITLNFELEINPTIQGNANEFTHSMLNLILNAKDAFDTSPALNPIITVHVSEQNETCMITVSDNAGGIRVDPVDMVFDMHITTKESGSGLGLFMTKKIIEQRFGGTITVENKEGGACFTITLPYSQYSENHADTLPNTEKLSLDRINQLSRKVIELEEVEKTLKKWADIFQKAHWGIAIHVGTSNHFESTNEAFNTLYGYTPQELRNITVPDLFPPETLSLLPEVQQRAFEKGYAAFETINKRRDGSTFPVSIELIVAKDDKGDILYHMANIWDLTEKKAAEKELILLNKALNNTNEAVYITILGTIIQVNDGACKMLGYSREEFASMTLFDIDKDVTPEDMEAIALAITNKGNLRFERKHYTKDGRVLDVEIVGHFFEHEGINYSFSAVRDITEQKKAREELLLKEFALDTINEAVYLIDENSMFHYVNEGACTALGYTKEELLTMGVIHIDPNATREWWWNHWGALKEEKSFLVETSHRRKDGSEFPIEVSINYFEYNGIGYNLAVVRDITERRQLEAQKDNERMRLFFERQLVGMAITSPEHGWIHTNEKLQQMLGYSHEELSTMTWTEMTYPEDLAPDMEQFERLLRGEIEDYMLEKRFIRKDGSIVYTNLAVSCVRNDDRSLNYVLALLEDITERKAAQEALEEKEREFRSLAENIPDNIARWDTERRYLYINPVQERLLCITPEDIIGKSLSEAFPNVDFSILDGAMAQVIETGEAARFVRQPFQNIHGDMEFHNINLVPERDNSGKIVGVLGIGRDMTDIYRMQDEIATKERELRALADSSPGMMGAYHLKPDGSVCMPYASPNIVDIFGVTPEEVREDATHLMALHHPEDTQRVHDTIAQSAQSMSVWHEEYRILHPTKGVRWMESNTMPQPHPDGGIIWYGYVHDITQRKELEALLEKERRFLIDAQHVAHTGSWYLDIVHGVLSWSDESYRIFEFDKENIDDLHKAFYECVHPDDREMVQAPYEESLKTKLPYQLEHRIVMEDGRIKYVIERCEHIYDDNGDPLYSIGTVQDITERKEMEALLQNANDRYLQILDNSTDVIYLIEVTPEGHFVYVDVNAAYEEVTGIARDVVIGLDVEDIEDETFRTILIDKFTTCLNAGEKTDYTADYSFPIGVRTFHSILLPIRNNNGQIVRIVGVARDITERQEMEESLKKALEFNEGIIGAIPDLLFEITPEGIYVGVWAQDEALLAAQKEIMLENNFKDILPPDVVITALQAMKEVDEKGFSLGKTYSLDLPEGKRWFELSVSKKKISGNYIVLARDVTERKAAEEALQSNRNLLRTILESSPGIITFALDTHYRYIAFDSKHAEVMKNIFGKEVALGINMLELITPDTDREIAKRSFDRVLGGEDFIAEEEYGDERLSRHYWQIFYAPIRSESGEIIGLACFNMDITERRQKEETIRELNTTLEEKIKERTLQLQQSLEFSEGVINALPDLLFEIDSNGTYLNIWARDEELLAAQKELLLGHTLHEVLSKESADTVMEALGEAELNGTSFGKIIKIELPQGVRYFEQSVSKKSSTNTFVVLSRDITERLEAEKTLREREDKFYQLFKLSPSAISITSLERNIYLDVNDSFLFHTEYTRDEVVGKGSGELGIFVDPQERAELFRRIAEDGVVNDFRYHYRTKNGAIGYAAAYGSVITYRGEKCYLGHSYDMSAYQEVEELQKERLALEKHLSKLAATVPGVNYIFEKTAEGMIRFTYLAPTFEELFGLSADAAMENFGVVMELIHNEDRETIRQSIVVTAEELSNWHEEFRILHPMRGELWIEGQSSPERKSDGTIVWYGFFHNITERKRIEKALKESEETFRAIVENSPDVISRYDLQMRRTYVNPMMKFLMGKASEELIGKTPREFSPLPDVETFEQLFNAVVRGKSEIEHEDFYTAPWGERRWGNQRIVPEFDEDQNVISVMVIGRDMTERKNAERQLKLLETAINSYTEAVYINDKDLSIVYVNDEACRMLGYSRNELLSMKIIEIDAKYTIEEIDEIIETKIREGKVIFETQHRKKDGSVIDVEIAGSFFIHEEDTILISLVKEI